MVPHRMMHVFSSLWLSTIAAAQSPPPQPSTTSTPQVVRDKVLGAMIHGRGETKWSRTIGRVQVLDSRTLKFADGTRLELDIMSPALGQWAQNGDVFYPCGKEAADFLRRFIDDRIVICFQNGEGPLMAYVDDASLEQTMIVNGWALADHSSLHAPEIVARENRRGLWRGKFVAPDDWRNGQRLPGEEEAAKLAAANRPAAPARTAILGRWNSLDRHASMGSLFQPVHGVRKREAVVMFEEVGDSLLGTAIMEDHRAITNQERWTDGRTLLQKVRFENQRLTFEFPVDEWIKTAGPLGVEDRRLENKGTIRVDATLDRDRLVGRWRMFLADETEVFRGEWEAVRAGN